MKWFDLRVGGVLDVLPTLPDRSVNCCVTSPPYWGLRSYLPEGHDDKHMEIGLEPTPEEYVAKMVAVFREVRRVLRDDGTLWLNLGDSYASSPPGNSAKGVSWKSTLHGIASDTYRETLAQGHATKRNTVVGGLKPKDLVGIPWRVAFALQADGWWLRQDIVWSKPSPMPESVRDRCTKAHEYIFLLSKSGSTLVWRARDTGEWSKNPDLSETVPHKTLPNERVARWRGFDYYYDAEAISEKAATGVWDAMPRIGGVKHSENEFHGGGTYSGKTPPGNGCRNKRSVWTVTTKPFKEAHFATFPPDLIEPCILAGCPEGGVVLDPFIGSGTTAMVAIRNSRRCVGIDLNPAYADMAIRRASGPVCDRESDLFDTPAILTP